jgi:uncharacterized protein
VRPIAQLSFVAVGLVWPLSAEALGPSFDCSKAAHPDEIMICERPELAELDMIVASGYGFLKARYGRPFADQIGIPTWRSRQACLADADCIRRRQIDAIAAYRAAGAPVSVPPWAFASSSSSNPSITSMTSPSVAAIERSPTSPAQTISPSLSDDGWGGPIRVALQLRGGTFVVPVTINDRINLDFTVDSGASTVAIPADVFGTLIRAGTIGDADFIGKKTFTLADGSEQTQQTFRIRSLKVGDRILHDVEASVAPVAGELRPGRDKRLIALVTEGRLHDPETGEFICNLSELGAQGQPLPQALRSRLP